MDLRELINNIVQLRLDVNKLFLLTEILVNFNKLQSDIVMKEMDKINEKALQQLIDRYPDLNISKTETPNTN